MARPTYAQQRARLKQRFAAVPQAVTLALQPVLEKCAAELIELARQLAPEASGDLKASIHAEPGDHALAIRIVAGDEDAFYARWVEFGTADTPSHAFLFPAFRLLKARFERRINRAVKKAVADAWAKP